MSSVPDSVISVDNYNNLAADREMIVGTHMALSWNPDWRIIPVGSVNITSYKLVQWRSAAGIPGCITLTIDTSAPYTRQRVTSGGVDFGYWPVPRDSNCACVFNPNDPEYPTQNAAGLAWPTIGLVSCMNDPDERIMGLRIWHEIMHCMTRSGAPDEMLTTPGFVTYLEQKYGYNNPFVVEFRNNKYAHEHDPDYQEEFYTYLVSVYFPWCLTGAQAPPVADFIGSPQVGEAPLTVVFTNKSLRYTSCTWDFGDGTTSTFSSPIHTYTSAGNYTVRLTVYNESGSDTKTIPGYIVVTQATGTLKASFRANPTQGTAPLKVQFTDTSTGSPTWWNWRFGDGYTSNARNPSHTYAWAGVFDVSLEVGNSYTSSETTVPGAIRVQEPGGGEPPSGAGLDLSNYVVPITIALMLIGGLGVGTMLSE